MVLDNGKLVEFDTPENLLRDQKSELNTMLKSAKNKCLL